MASKALTYERVMTAVQNNEFAPLYFLYGDESFLIDEVQREVMARALQPHERDFNLDIVYGADADVKDVLALCAGYPVMAQRRVVIVREFERLKENRLFMRYAERANPSAVVVLVCASRPNLSAHPYRALKQHAVAVEFKPLRSREMPAWVESRMRSLGYKAEPRAVHMLTEYLGTDLRTAAAEIDKLATYTGTREVITADDVVHASGQTREFSVFELQKAIGENRFADAVRIGERLLQHAANPQGEALMIVAVLTGYFSKLWRLLPCQAQRMSEGAMAAQVGVPPYYISEYVGALRRLGPSGVERAFAALVAADFELKGGSTRDAHAVMLLLLTRLVASRR